MIPLIIFVVIVVLVLAFVAGNYNALVALKNRCNEGWADIDVQLKRRYDLIPNLVETVKGYATHERETFEKVTQARTSAMAVQDPAQKAQAENILTSALKSLFAVAEAYPELKANQNFLDLQKSLQEIEDAIQNARRYYNATVKDNNNKVEMFPSNIIANMFGFKKRDFFEIEGEGREPVKVNF